MIKVQKETARQALSIVLRFRNYLIFTNRMLLQSNEHNEKKQT